MTSSIRYREAQVEDMEAVHRLIRQLADFEEAAEAVDSDAEMYREDGFGDQPRFHCIVAEHPELGIVGCALCFRAYSTWKGKMIFLDDLVVDAAFRRQGIGGRLLDEVVGFAKADGAALVKWQVLDWNQPAIEMYQKIGAVFDSEWIDCKLYRSQWE